MLSQKLQIRIITQQFGYKIRFEAAYIFKYDGWKAYATRLSLSTHFHLHFHRGMNITVEHNAFVWMSKQLAHSLGVKHDLNAYSSTGVTNQMKVSAANIAAFQYCLQVILHGARLHQFISSRKDIVGTFVLFRNIQNKCGDQDISHRVFLPVGLHFLQGTYPLATAPSKSSV